MMGYSKIRDLPYRSFDRYTIMIKCWREDPQERPQFAELVKIIEDMLGVGLDYLDLDCLAGVTNKEYFMDAENPTTVTRGN